MALADIKNWISGETEAFFDPIQTSRAAARVDSNPGGERLTERASIGKFVQLPSPALLERSLPLLWFILLF
jgi:hypothetical protein